MDAANSNARTARDAGADGEDALLLVESLIHDLIGRGTLSTADAVGIVEVAIEVKAELAREREGPVATGRVLHGGLDAIAASLRHGLIPK